MSEFIYPLRVQCLFRIERMERRGQLQEGGLEQKTRSSDARYEQPSEFTGKKSLLRAVVSTHTPVTPTVVARKVKYSWPKAKGQLLRSGLY